MKKKCLLLLLFCLPLLSAAAGFNSQGAGQTTGAADFPPQLLQGSENLILVIDVYGDTIIMGPITEGRMLSEVRLNVKSGTHKLDVESHAVPLDRTVSDDPLMGELVRRAQAEAEKALK